MKGVCIFNDIRHTMGETHYAQNAITWIPNKRKGNPLSLFVKNTFLSIFMDNNTGVETQNAKQSK